MGKIKRGILGGFSGKVANVVGGSWKGVAYMRSQPLSVSNPKTAAQQAQRGTFAFTTSVASTLLATIAKPLWDRFAVQMSGYNALVKANVGILVDFANTNWLNFVTSMGSMPVGDIQFVEIETDSENLTCTWTDIADDGAKLATDKVFIVVVNVTQEYVKGFATTAIRSDEGAQVQVGSDFVEGDVVYGYLSFMRADGTMVSNSAVKVATEQA